MMSDAIEAPPPYPSAPSVTTEARLVDKAVAIGAERLEPAERAVAATLIAKFYEHAPPSDVAERSPRDLGGAALALWRFAGRRRPGHAKIRVYNPELEAD